MSKPKIENVLPILQGLLAGGQYIFHGREPGTKCERADEAIHDAIQIAAMLEGVLNDPTEAIPVATDTASPEHPSR